MSNGARMPSPGGEVHGIETSLVDRRAAIEAQGVDQKLLPGDPEGTTAAEIVIELDAFLLLHAVAEDPGVIDQLDCGIHEYWPMENGHGIYVGEGFLVRRMESRNQLQDFSRGYSESA